MRPARLEEAVRHMVRRHEILRSGFPSVPGLKMPVQVVREGDDGVTLDRVAGAPGVHALMSQACASALDPVAGSTLRTTLARRAPGVHLLVLTLPALCADDAALDNLVAEIARALGPAAEPPGEPLQYADVAEFLNELVESDETEAGRQFWRELPGLAPSASAPLPLRAGAGSSDGGSDVARTLLEPTAAERLEQLGAEDVPTPLFLLTCWAALLGRRSGSSSVVIGAASDGRAYAGMEEAIGCFEKLLPIVASPDPGRPFESLLEEVSEAWSSAVQWQEYLSEEVLEERLGQARSERLIRHAFVYRDRGPSFEAGDLRLTVMEKRTRLEESDLELTCTARAAGELELQLRFDRARFARGDVERLLGQFRTLVASAAGAPESAVGRLDLVGPAERDHLLHRSNQTARKLADGCLHELVAERAVHCPDRIALSASGVWVSYGELVSRAHELAGRLRGAGAGPDVPVAVALERSPELVVSLLGTLFSGGAFVPLDPAAPEGRNRLTLEWVSPPVLVTRAEHRDRLPDLSGLRLEVVEATSGGPGEGERVPLPAVSSRSLAYVAFTSGSTGRPKGVMISHGGICNRLLWMQREYPLAEGDRILQKTPASFDASIWEVFSPLIAGATAVLARPGRERETDYLVAELVEKSITVLQVVPSLLRALLAEPLLERCRSLRRLFCGGEALPLPLADRFEEVTGARLVNLYGPTEVAIDATHWPHAPGWGSGIAPLGTPIANARVYLADDDLELAATGLDAELLVAGAGLARGYLGEPALTAGRFVPDPFGSEPGGRLYRTGDVGRFRPDGMIEFVGRMDRQVKVRGVRTELGEVEAALAVHPAIREAVVECRRDGSGDARLVAWIVPDPHYTGGAEPDGGQRVRTERMDQWRAVFEDMYEASSAHDDPLGNMVGWKSSYTSEALPQEAMEEWVRTTVDRILALGPRRVLEIGCGTGLLLFRLAPQTETYVGTDFSEAVVTYVRHHADRLGLHQVRVERRSAEDFHGLPGGPFDLVILNSVVQYFPSVEYLLEVIRGALDLLAPGGSLFLGDLRNFGSLDLFHASVQLAQAAPGTTCGELATRVRRAVDSEEELTVHPAFFAALRSADRRVAAVTVLTKRGRHQNELTRFRYDVVLRRGEGEPPPKPPRLEWMDWRATGLDLERVRELLARERPPRVAFSRIPDARVARDRAATALLAKAPPSRPVPAVLEATAYSDTDGAVDPEELWALIEELGYEAEVAPSVQGEAGTLDAVLHRSGASPEPGGAAVMEVAGGKAQPDGRWWAKLANNPLLGRLSRDLVPCLPDYLSGSLPEPMIPRELAILRELPRLASGKLDRSSLPEPGAMETDGDIGAVPHETPTEEIVSALFGELLGRDRVSAEDDFFALGGHSLVATQLVARLRRTFGIDLPIAELFEDAEVRGLARRIDTLLGLGGTTDLPPIRSARRDGPLPASYPQRQLWLWSRMQPAVAAYNLPAPVRIRGELDPGVLAGCLRAIVARHESLRTTFAEADGDVVQIVAAPPASFNLPVIDLSGLSAPGSGDEARRLAREEPARPFDIEQGPLVRAILLRVDPVDHLLAVTMHHIVSDGWSTGVLIREFASLYRAFAAGDSAPLAELPVQYGDFAHWQRSWLQGEPLERRLDFWRAQLEGAPRVLELPSDRRRPPRQTFRGALITRRLSATLTSRLKVLARERAVTPFMVCLAAYGLLLHRYSGQEDILIGTNVANRRDPSLEGVIGFFVNNLILRLDLSGGGFHELLERVRGVSLGAFAHQDLPFERLVEELRPVRDPSRSPLFQVMFVYQTPARLEEEVPGLELSMVEIDIETAKFDLTLFVVDRRDHLECQLEYSTDLFKPSTARRMLEQYGRLLEQVVDDPECAIERYVLDAEPEGSAAVGAAFTQPLEPLEARVPGGEA